MSCGNSSSESKRNWWLTGVALKVGTSKRVSNVEIRHKIQPSTKYDKYSRVVSRER